VEINRRPEDVFVYLDDLGRHNEWDDQIISTRVETEGHTRVGTRATDTRRTPMGKQDVTYEITEHDLPRRAAFRGTSGPVRPVGAVTVESLDDGARSRVTIEIELQGHGLGKLLAPLANRDARKNVPKNQAKLKERLESASG
jgi:uncharacterized membrane protein